MLLKLYKNLEELATSLIWTKSKHVTRFVRKLFKHNTSLKKDPPAQILSSYTQNFPAHLGNHGCHEGILSYFLFKHVQGFYSGYNKEKKNAVCDPELKGVMRVINTRKMLQTIRVKVVMKLMHQQEWAPSVQLLCVVFCLLLMLKSNLSQKLFWDHKK